MPQSAHFEVKQWKQLPTVGGGTPPPPPPTPIPRSVAMLPRAWSLCSLAKITRPQMFLLITPLLYTMRLSCTASIWRRWCWKSTNVALGAPAPWAPMGEQMYKLINKCQIYSPLKEDSCQFCIWNLTMYFLGEEENTTHRQPFYPSPGAKRCRPGHWHEHVLFFTCRTAWLVWTGSRINVFGP